RTRYDLEMLEEMGFCQGIENYSRHMSGREPGSRPYTLIDYFPDDFLIITDESHVTIPQIGGMYNGDKDRKMNLVEYGFRLPSALDNRPLKFTEFESMVNQIMYVSATPGPYEYKNSQKTVEQIIRPTGLLDPRIEVRPIKHQIDDLVLEIEKTIDKGERVLVTTLTKKMAEDLTRYFTEIDMKVTYLHSDIETIKINKIKKKIEKYLIKKYKKIDMKVTYLHSDIDTIERMEIIRDLRLGKYDVLVGINLLREGLDLPEVSLIAILDADKEGFL